MAILHEHVESYLRSLRPERDGVMAEMEALAQRDSVPIMSGEVALPGGADTGWGDESLAAARALNAELLAGTGWLGSVLPVGDGVALATRRS